MGVRTRGLDIKAGAAKLKADRAARLEAEAVIDRWNRRLATGRDMLWSPTIRAALIAGTPWLDVFCPGCGTSGAIDLRTLDRHPLASVGTLVLGLRCSWCPGSAPMPKLLGLCALPPPAGATAASICSGDGGGGSFAHHDRGPRPAHSCICGTRPPVIAAIGRGAFWLATYALR
jgi:hypothetical protein